MESLCLTDAAPQELVERISTYLYDDIFIMIFDRLRDLQASTRRSIQLSDATTDELYQPRKWRLVCRQWNQILIPRVYADVDCGYNAFRGKFDDKTYQGVLAKIRTYARRVKVPVGFVPGSNIQIDHEDTVQVLSECRALQSIECQFVNLAEITRRKKKILGVPEMPAILYDALLKWSKINVSFTARRDNVTNLSINPDFPQGFCNVVSVDVELYMKDTNLQPFLVASPNVKFLSIHALDGWGFEASQGRLPAFKELQLRNYGWSHSRADTEAIWNFSKLESLLLHMGHNRSNAGFLTVALSQRFPKLKRLNCHNPRNYRYQRHGERDSNLEVDRALGKLIPKLPELEDLTIHYFAPSELVHSIAEVGPRLRKLRMHVGSDYFMRNIELREIQKTCTNLVTLGLHRYPSKDQVYPAHEQRVLLADNDKDGVAFLETLCQFEKLTWLKLEYQRNDYKQPILDAEATELYKYMLRKKRGTRLQKFEFVDGFLRKRYEPVLERWISEGA